MLAPTPQIRRYLLRCCATLVLALLLPFARTSAEHLAVRPYSTADGLVSSAVNCLLYDSRGFLWLGTRDGLSRFDGYRFTNYHLGTAAAGANTGISQLLERRNGDYLIAGQNAEIYRFNQQTTVTESAVDGSLTLNVEKLFDRLDAKILEDRDGNLWVGGQGGLSRITEAGGKFSLGPPLAISGAGVNFTSFIFYLEDNEGTFWLTADPGLVRIDKTGRVLALYQTPPPSLRRPFLNHLFADREGRIWVLSQNGLWVLKPDVAPARSPVEPKRLAANIKDRLPAAPGEILRLTTADGFNSRNVQGLRQTTDGRIWLAGDDGLSVFQGAQFRRFSGENGVAEYLTDIQEDRAGNLWIASFSGVFKLAPNGFSTYGKPDGLARSDIAAIYQTSNGELFAAQGDWFVSGIHGNGFTTVQPELGPERGSPMWTSNISFLDSRNSWWFLTDTRLTRFDPVERLETIATRKPAAEFFTGEQFKHGGFYRVFEDSRGDIWISTRSPDPNSTALNVWKRKENKLYAFTAADGFPARLPASAFCEDRQGNLWVGFYYGGLARYRDGKFTFWGSDAGIPPGFVTSLLLDHAGRLWVGTSEGGLNVIDDVTAAKPAFRKIEGLASNNVRAVAEDNFGRIYAGTVRGIDRYSPDTAVVVHRSTIDGLADDFVTAAFRDRDGALWFGTRNGLSKLVPEADKPASAPPILIAGLRVAGEKRSISEFGAAAVPKLDLKSAQNNLQIDFFSVGVPSPEQIRYQVKLENADDDWSRPTTERTVNYANLAPGDYRFLVRAVNAQGQVSEAPATVVFHIARPFWRTWWFSLLAVLLVVGGVYFVLHQRFRRSLELEKVRTRIASDLHDDIGAGLSRISMLSEVVRQQSGAANAEASGRLGQIAADARGLVDSMSDIVWAIDPRRDSIQSVVDRVCSFAADTLGTQNVRWSVSTPPELRRLHLTAEEKRNLYLIFKEAINNIAKHAGCRNASLAIEVVRGELRAIVLDDGKGLATAEPVPATSRGGNGLANMRARTDEMGGKLDLESTQPSGTKIILTLPLANYRINGWFGWGKK